MGIQKGLLFRVSDQLREIGVSPICTSQTTRRYRGEELDHFVSSSKFYAPKPSDVTFPLQFTCVARDVNTQEPLCSPISLATNAVRNFPDLIPRRFITLLTPVAPSERTFKVLTYNILSNTLIGDPQYEHCKKWAAHWSFRRELLLKEITSYEPDIVCLQEMQFEHYQDFMEPQLRKYGFEGTYKGKNRPDGHVGPFSEGCATFFRKSCFSLVKKYEIEYKSIAQKKFQPGLELDRCSRPQVALILKLVFSKNGSKEATIFMANTHLVPKLRDLKFLQAIFLHDELWELTCGTSPIILCGDLNSRPGSEVCQFLKGENVNTMKLRQDVYTIKGRPPIYIIEQGIFSSKIPLESAYSALELASMRQNEPYFTSYNIGAWIDYIFFTESLACHGVLEVLDKNSEQIFSGMPSSCWPSNHLSLMASFSFKF